MIKKQNKAPQAKIKQNMVDITKLHTPTGYADLIGQSRANVYLLIKAGSIKAENIYKIDNQQVILEDGLEEERRIKAQGRSSEKNIDVNKPDTWF